MSTKTKQGTSLSVTIFLIFLILKFFLCNSISFNIWCKIKIKRFKNICLFKNIFLSLYLLNLKTIIMRRIGDKLVILDENGSYLVIGTFKMGSTGEYIDYSI
jgi:hypothetical protein